MPRSTFGGTGRLGLSLLLAPFFVWGGIAMAQDTPYGTAAVPVNATCQHLIDTGYTAPSLTASGQPLAAARQAPFNGADRNLLVDDCYPPYGNQIPNVNNTEDESGNLNFPAVAPPPPKGWNEVSAWNLQAVGYNDNQSRVIYQPLVFNYQSWTTSSAWKNHEILFNGDIAGTAPNPLVAGSPIQPNGTSIVDVTVPNETVALYHIPAGPTPTNPAVPANNGAQMVRACAGNQLNADSSALSAAANNGFGTAWKGNPAIANKVYLLRENGNGTGTHEIWDVSIPTAPVFVADLLVNNYTYSGATGTPADFTAAALPAEMQATHKNWWECDTGIAYIVGGKTADFFGTLQHVYIYNLRDPSHPVFIRQYAIPGGQQPASLNTGNCTNAPSSTSCYEGTTNPPGSVHGPISMGNLVNRVYMPWGISSDGIIQITARDQLINACFTTAARAWQQTGTATGFHAAASATCGELPGGGSANASTNPTEADMLWGQISVVTMQPTQGGHSSMPVLGVPIPEEQEAYLSRGYPVGWDMVFVSSEGTANNCSGQDAHEAWIETVGIFQLPGAFPAAPGGFQDVTGAAGQYQKTYSATDAQQWPEATLSVPEQPGGFCAKGFRFGAHSVTEAIFPAYYGKIQCVSWFGGGARCWDIRDPKNPLPIAYWSSMPGPATTNIGNLGATLATAGTYYAAPGGSGVAVDRNATDQNYVEFDDRGYLYIVDRAGTGTAILRFSGGTPEQIITAPTVLPGTCPKGDSGSCQGQ